MRKVRAAFLFLLLLLTGFCMAQTKSVTVISDSSFIKSELFVLGANWKFQNGDNLRWREQEFNDEKWDSVYTALDFEDISENPFNGRAWFRLHFFLDSVSERMPLSFIMRQYGASEIYLDGRLIHALGKIYPEGSTEKELKFSAGQLPYSLPLMQKGGHVLAVRYSNHDFKKLYERYHLTDAGFNMILVRQDKDLDSLITKLSVSYTITLSLGIFFLTFAFIHLLLFLFYRKQKTNLFYSGFVTLLSCIFLLPAITFNTHDPVFSFKIGYYVFFFLPVFFNSLLGLLSYLLFKKQFRIFWISLLLIPLVLLSKHFLSYRLSGLFSFCYIFMCVTASFVMVIMGIRQKKDGAKIIGTGALCFLLFLAVLIVRNMFGYGTFIGLDLKSGAEYFILGAVILAIMSIPLSMSVYLARDFARTSRGLENKLEEVKQLSEKNLQQEKEKQKILEGQKEMLETQVTERTAEITRQKQLIEEKNKEVTDSIRYASRIQRALLTQEKYFEKALTRMNK